MSIIIILLFENDMNINRISINNKSNLYFCARKPVKNPQNANYYPSCFESMTPLQKLNSIISPKELQTVYNGLCEFLELDIKPKLNLIHSDDKVFGGGYNFMANEINLGIESLVATDYKAYGISRGKEHIITSNDVYMPIFGTKESIEKFISDAASDDSYNYETIGYKPTTMSEKKRIIVQKIAHELIHAQQYMVLRQTEGIGVMGVLKACFHRRPRNSSDLKRLNQLARDKFNESFWAKQAPTPVKFQRYSDMGLLASQWLEAVIDYSANILSYDYLYNELEQDAYLRSSKYMEMLYGPLN